ncbi:hypothetical protein FH508_0019690 [Lysinibacillus sp. CD3-6]|uniref:hypothetical protein n=1 Tax=Lysinibacillus sp. CD3-6 TaxID=2892541 RepID=UPI00116E6A8D|nr:hypothetical protein [Lysinibacillus sp. CD3-6]UED79598.1 hypothetical protein FH508_0019690 [Lysinibacillus sp. CD3-6]
MTLRKHKEYQMSQIIRVYAKSINKDRMMLNLLPLIKHNGKKVSFKKANFTKEDVFETIYSSDYYFENFGDYKGVVESWLENDYMDLINKESTTQEKRFVSILPITLNVYKVTNTKNIEDYESSDQIWVMLKHADCERSAAGETSIIKQLNDYFSVGYSSDKERIENHEELDLSTWLISNITNQFDDVIEVSDVQAETTDPLLCMAQARILADDVERLLQYQDVMARPALIESLSQLFVLHMGLYVLRVARILPVAIQNKTIAPSCTCHEQLTVEKAYACDYKPKFQMDMQPKYSSKLAKISARNIDMHEQQLYALYESLVILRKKQDFMMHTLNQKKFTIEEIVSFDLQQYWSQCENYFKQQYEQLNDLLEVLPNITENYFENYIAAIVQNFGKHFVGFYKRLLSVCFGKNLDRGILMQTASHKKYSLGIELLDTIMHLAMIEKREGVYENKVLRLDQFLTFLRERYGFYIDELLEDYDQSQFYSAIRESKKYLTMKLQEIGYYEALSDAYNTQWLIARYDISRRVSYE